VWHEQILRSLNLCAVTHSQLKSGLSEQSLLGISWVWKALIAGCCVWGRSV